MVKRIIRSRKTDLVHKEIVAALLAIGAIQ